MQGKKKKKQTKSRKLNKMKSCEQVFFPFLIPLLCSQFPVTGCIFDLGLDAISQAI